jgi:hypothetical protein
MFIECYEFNICAPAERDVSGRPSPRARGRVIWVGAVYKPCVPRGRGRRLMNLPNTPHVGPGVKNILTSFTEYCRPHAHDRRAFFNRCFEVMTHAH